MTNNAGCTLAEQGGKREMGQKANDGVQDVHRK
jgi:hypothetical protein